MIPPAMAPEFVLEDEAEEGEDVLEPLSCEDEPEGSEVGKDERLEVKLAEESPRVAGGKAKEDEVNEVAEDEDSEDEEEDDKLGENETEEDELEEDEADEVELEEDVPEDACTAFRTHLWRPEPSSLVNKSTKVSVH